MENSIISELIGIKKKNSKYIDPHYLENQIPIERRNAINKIEILEKLSDDVINKTSMEPREQGYNQCSIASYSSAVQGYFKEFNKEVLYSYIYFCLFFNHTVNHITKHFNFSIYDDINIINVGKIVEDKFKLKVEQVEHCNPIDIITEAINFKKYLVFSIELSYYEWTIFANRCAGGKDKVDLKPNNETETRHAMTIVGYNLSKKCFIIKNHYNEKNFFYLPFKLLNQDYTATNHRLMIISNNNNNNNQP